MASGDYSDLLSRLQQGMQSSETQQRKEMWLWEQITQRPTQMATADDAFLTEEGLVIEVGTFRVKVLPTLMRRLWALIQMAELAKLLPPEKT